MARKSPPRHRFTLAAQRRSAKLARPRIEQLEGRIAPALFNVQSSVALGATNNFGCIATGDFNGDGKTDIVMTNYGYQDLITGNLVAGNTFLVKLGNGDGTFGGTNTFTVGSDQLVSFVAVGDLNHDNNLDLAVVSSNLSGTSGMLRIYLGNGSGGFTLSAQGAIATGSNNACWVGIAQMTNGDTNPDVVVSAFGSTDQGQTTVFGNAITVFQGDGTGAVNNLGSITNGISFLPTALALADFNGDGKMDIAATVPGVPPDETSPQPNGTVQIITGNGAGGFTLGNSFDSGGALPINIQAAYLNGDNLPDLVIANAGDPDQPHGFANFGSNNSVGVAINGGGGSFNTTSMTAGLGVSGSKSVFAVATSDFDLDGKQDIAAIVYGNPATGANARVLEFKGDGAGGFAADADSPYNTTTTDGQYLAVAPLDANSTPDIVYCTAAGRYGVLVNTTVAAPTVTINQAAGQADPTNVSPVSYAVHFSEAVTGFDGSDISFTGSTVGGTLVAGVTGSGQDYSVNVTGMSGTGTVKATILAGAATGTSSGQSSLASTSTDNTVTFDNVAPTVTINQAASQADPTQTGPIQFTVVFSENVTGFTSSDVDLSSSSLTSLTATVTQNSPSNYTVSVSGMSGTGTVVAKVIAGAATDAAGNSSAASTSTDNTVFFGTGPSVTINQAAGQADPTNSSSISYTVHFSESVTGFDGSDILFTGSTVGGTLVAGVSGSGQDYTVTVSGMTGAGTVVASVKAGAAVNGIGAGNSASTSTDNTVTFDGVSPSVTINQTAGQADPTNGSSISFNVNFSEAVTGFTAADVSLTGSTAGGTLTVNVTGALDTYVVTVTGMTTSGSVIASVPAGGATDAVGNPNLASTSSDNSVGFINNGTLGFTQPVYTVSEDGGSVLVTVSRTGPTGGAVSIDYSMTDGTAHHGGTVARGQDDYTPVSGTLSWTDGEGGDKTFSIPILQDSLNEGRELINLALTNSIGFPGLGVTTAAVAIAPSDGQGPGKYLDTDGDKYTITLYGPKTGSLVYFRTDPDGDSRGPIELIQLTGTTSNLPRPNALWVTVAKSLTSTDSGTVGVGAITGSPVRRIYAPRATLNLEGINLDGYVAGIRVGSIVNGADITTLASVNPLERTAINALAIGDGTNINIGGAVSALTATRIGVGSIVAPRIISMVVRGQPMLGVIGDMDSDITLSGLGVPTNRRALGLLSVAGSIPVGADIVAPSVGTIIVKRDLSGNVTVSGQGLDPGLRALGALRVAGAVSGSDIKVNGNVGGVRVGAFRNSRLFAGYQGADDGTGTFTTQATVAAFVSTGRFNGFENSRLIATAFQYAWINNLDSTNASPFGFYADASLGVITVISPLRFIYDPTISAPQGVGDFEVAIV